MFAWQRITTIRKTSSLEDILSSLVAVRKAVALGGVYIKADGRQGLTKPPPDMAYRSSTIGQGACFRSAAMVLLIEPRGTIACLFLIASRVISNPAWYLRAPY